MYNTYSTFPCMYISLILVSMYLSHLTVEAYLPYLPAVSEQCLCYLFIDRLPPHLQCLQISTWFTVYNYIIDKTTVTIILFTTTVINIFFTTTVINLFFIYMYMINYNKQKQNTLLIHSINFLFHLPYIFFGYVRDKKSELRYSGQCQQHASVGSFCNDINTIYRGIKTSVQTVPCPMHLQQFHHLCIAFLASVNPSPEHEGSFIIFIPRLHVD